MGWNSFDCYDLAATEEDILGNAEYMARHLKNLGWEYVVLDMSWYDPASAAWGRGGVPLIIDEYGRYQPCPVKFPSSIGGKGLKPLADQIHALGLKFGIHIMRGISRQAVRQNSPILGTEYRAQDIADTRSVCAWWDQSYGINPEKDGAQEWYDSNLRLYAEWEVDFIKADDMSSPYVAGEIELVRKAIDKCGRDIVLSLSPGEAPVQMAEHLKQHANLWRISADFWDEWSQLRKMFDLLEKWIPHMGPGHWPDADMLPLGAISIRRNPPKPPRFTRFSTEEQRTLMTLWCIAKSPLMFGGDLRVLDPWTISLITNRDVLEMHRSTKENRVLFHSDYGVVWAAKAEGVVYLALFNTSELEEVQMSVNLTGVGIHGTVRVMELWTREDLGMVRDRIQTVVPPHGTKLYKLQG